jgi:hypothetical protein
MLTFVTYCAVIDVGSTSKYTKVKGQMRPSLCNKTNFRLFPTSTRRWPPLPVFQKFQQPLCFASMTGIVGTCNTALLLRSYDRQSTKIAFVLIGYVVIGKHLKKFVPESVFMRTTCRGISSEALRACWTRRSTSSEGLSGAFNVGKYRATQHAN